MTDSAAARTAAPLEAAPRYSVPPVVPLAVGTAASALPALRLLQAPSCAPPYDDEAPGRPALRLVTTPTARRSAPPAGSPARRPDAPPPARTALPADHRVRTPTAGLPAPRPFALAFVQRLLEVCGGVRPVGQLQRDTSPGLYAELEKALVRRPRATGHRPSGRDVHSVHVQQRPDGVAEVCATVRRGARVGAVALRLEGVHGRWLCTQLQGV